MARRLDARLVKLFSRGSLVHMFDWKVTAPFQATIPMVEVMEFEGDKVKRARLFFDSALFPAEIKAQMMSQTVV